MKIELKITDGRNIFDSDVYVELRGEPVLTEKVEKAIQQFVQATEGLTIK